MRSAWPRARRRACRFPQPTREAVRTRTRGRPDLARLQPLRCGRSAALRGASPWRVQHLRLPKPNSTHLPHFEDGPPTLPHPQAPPVPRLDQEGDYRLRARRHRLVRATVVHSPKTVPSAGPEGSARRPARLTEWPYRPPGQRKLSTSISSDRGSGCSTWRIQRSSEETDRDWYRNGPFFRNSSVTRPDARSRYRMA